MDGKLTKKFLMGIAEGAYLVSNVFNRETAAPAFSEQVAAKDQRDDQWERIKKAGADGRNCLVFRTKEAADQWLKRIYDRFNSR